MLACIPRNSFHLVRVLESYPYVAETINESLRSFLLLRIFLEPYHYLSSFLNNEQAEAGGRKDWQAWTYHYKTINCSETWGFQPCYTYHCLSSGLLLTFKSTKHWESGNCRLLRGWMDPTTTYSTVWFIWETFQNCLSITSFQV